MIRFCQAIAALACAALAALVQPCVAAAAPFAGAPDQHALVQQATAYLQGLKSVTGRFSQTDPNGGSSSGTFYLQRPGKARFDYDPPAGLLVVSDGHSVAVSDRRLKTYNQYPLGRTPLVILLAREVRLDRGVTVTGVDQTPGGFTIDARDGKGQAEGRIAIHFRADPVALRGWTLTDGRGRQTRVSLGPLTPTSHFPPGLFDISNTQR